MPLGPGDPADEGQDAGAVHEVEIAEVDLNALDAVAPRLLVDHRPVGIEELAGLAHLHRPGDADAQHAALHARHDGHALGIERNQLVAHACSNSKMA
jgi:hypothetical protein